MVGGHTVEISLTKQLNIVGIGPSPGGLTVSTLQFYQLDVHLILLNNSDLVICRCETQMK